MQVWPWTNVEFDRVLGRKHLLLTITKSEQERGRSYGKDMDISNTRTQNVWQAQWDKFPDYYLEDNTMTQLGMAWWERRKKFPWVCDRLWDDRWTTWFVYILYPFLTRHLPPDSRYDKDDEWQMVLNVPSTFDRRKKSYLVVYNQYYQEVYLYVLLYYQLPLLLPSLLLGFFFNHVGTCFAYHRMYEVAVL